MNDFTQSRQFIANSLKVYDITNFEWFFKVFRFFRSFRELVTYSHVFNGFNNLCFRKLFYFFSFSASLVRSYALI